MSVPVPEQESTYNLYMSISGSYTLDYLVLVEVKDQIQCTYKYSRSKDYTLKREGITKDEADSIYQAGQILSECQLISDKQVQMKEYQDSNYDD